MGYRRLIPLFLLLAFTSLWAGPRVSDSDEAKARDLVSRMTLEEKIHLIAGQIDKFHTYAVPRLGIPSIRMSDGPQGFRFDSTSTFYPCGISLAATWNRQAAAKMGASLARGAKARGIKILLGPGVNIYRYPLCGRNYEYYGEDPYLASETACAYICGLQDNGVMATIKHFALNNQEYERHMVDSDADERTINEIYFPAFRKAVEKAGVGAVMTSYNRVNGTHSSENPWLIKENLRKWGHRGIVMSDWRSCYSTLNVIKGGLDLEMPREDVLNYERIKPLLDNGMVSESEIDEKCVHILQTFIAFGFLNGVVPDGSLPKVDPLCDNAAYEIAREGPVLLKNDGILPLNLRQKGRIVVMGPNADHIARGGGSGAVHAGGGREISLVNGLLSEGFDAVSIQEADPTVLSKARAVILALGFDETSERENKDRTYSLPEGQDSLVRAVLCHNRNVIVVINSGGEVSLSDWGAEVKAIIMDWYPGQWGGRVLAEILSGKVSPSGRLPFTFWGSEEQNPVSPFYHPVDYMYFGGRYRKSPYTEYREGLFLGYRGEKYFGRSPLYHFGYGLTYSSFSYSALKCGPDGTISFTLRNTGSREAAEVVQLYVCPEDSSVIRPDKELKDYQKINLSPGESRTVSFSLGDDAFSYYDAVAHGWKKAPGRYRICIGASAGDFRLESEISVK